MMALVKLCYVCVYDFYNVMYSSDPQLLTWLLNRKAPTAKEESNHKEEEEEYQGAFELKRNNLFSNN